jgi:hypothetical protein
VRSTRLLLSCSTLLILAAAVSAAPVVPGDQKTVPITDGEKEVKVKPNDITEIQIHSPSKKKRGVFNMEVTTDGDVVLGGTWSTVDPQLVTADGSIMIEVGLKPGAAGGAVAVSYEDGEGKKHSAKVTIQVETSKGGDKAPAASVVPGDQAIVTVSNGEVKVKPNDIIQFQVPNPSAKKKGVSDLDVTTDGDLFVAGAWNMVDPTAGTIMIVVGQKPGGGGTIAVSFKDGDGKKHTAKATIQVEKPK